MTWTARIGQIRLPPADRSALSYLGFCSPNGVGLAGIEPAASALSVLPSPEPTTPPTCAFAVTVASQAGSVPATCPFISGTTGRNRCSSATAASRSAWSLTWAYSSIVSRDVA
jgi:hypothetical protein